MHRLASMNESSTTSSSGNLWHTVPVFSQNLSQSHVWIICKAVGLMKQVTSGAIMLRILKDMMDTVQLRSRRGSPQGAHKRSRPYLDI